ncbi:hypothetical protein ABZX82_05045 [Streptomyces griseoflavus]|uniref:hypothetical protein n=1 Tax=Streptomyces griseoflavus TaxID=35619 RepID=UPI00167D2984|nr:hypothetical protein [Streptomyces griseoflavus]GGV17918.1 hypothetical protein GCM10010293_11810 [Streptomyces griseoflavus]
MACTTGNPATDLFKGFFEFLGDPVGTIIDLIAKSILAGAVTVFGDLVSSVPGLTGTTTAKEVNNQSQWIVVYLAVGSLLFASARMAVERRGDAGVTALKGIARVILVSGAATTVFAAAARVSEGYSDHLFAAGAERLLTDVGCDSDTSLGKSFLLLIIAFLLLISAIIHTILLYIRLGVLIVLLGTLPLAAAASMTDWGNGWWRKHIGWMIAWLLYKPAAALVMYAGTAMINSNEAGSESTERIAGIGVMLLSAVALPALLKLVMPATAALGGSAAMSGAMSQAGGALASGARSIAGRSAGGGGGQVGRAGPSGAAGTSGGSGAGGSAGKSGPSGSSGGNGSAGGAGAPGASAAGAGGSAAGGAGAASGATRAAAAAGGPAGMAVAAAITAAQTAGRVASGAVDDADGERGHNT